MLKSLGTRNIFMGHFISNHPGVFIVNLKGLKYESNVHNRLFAYDNET